MDIPLGRSPHIGNTAEEKIFKRLNNFVTLLLFDFLVQNVMVSKVRERMMNSIWVAPQPYIHVHTLNTGNTYIKKCMKIIGTIIH